MNIKEYAIRKFWETGHFWSPTNISGWNVTEEDLPKLKWSDPVVALAAISFSKMHQEQYTQAALRHHKRLPMYDGTLGPAMKDIVEAPRCAVPDYAPPPGVECHFEDPYVQQVVDRMRIRKAVGTGSWARCHGVGEFHAVTVKVNSSGAPSNLTPHLLQILRDVRDAYAEVGLLIHFIDGMGTDMLTGESRSDLPINIDFSFVDRSDGWIGLAILGNNESCSSRIWCKYLSSWIMRFTNVEAMRTDVGTLFRHEIGHNTGLEHTSGGTMNPSLVSGLPRVWTPEDKSTALLKRWFGGKPVPVGGKPVPPQPPDVTDRDTLQDMRIQGLEASVRWLARELGDLKERPT